MLALHLPALLALFIYYEDANPDIKLKHFHFTHNDVMSRSIGNKMLLADQRHA